MKTIEFKINDKNILVEKDTDYITRNEEQEIKLAIEDIIKDNQLSLFEGKLFDLSLFTDSMFSIIYKGIINTLENINNNKISVENIIFRIC
jgi:hypothetical protein